MAFYRVLVLRGILGTAVFLGSAAAAISNKERIADFFSKNKSKDKNKKVNEASGGTAVSGTATTTGTTEGSQEPAKNNTSSTDSKATPATETDKAQTGEQGASTPTTTPDGTGGGTGQTPAGGSQVETPNVASGQGTGGGAGGDSPSQTVTSNVSVNGANQAAGKNNDSTFASEEIKGFNEKITTTLKLPEGCKFDESTKDYTKECDVTKEQLQKVNFLEKTNSNGLTVDEIPSGLKLEIKILNKNSDEDKKKYGNNIKDKDLRFTFKGPTSDINIKKDSNDSSPMILKKGTDAEFEIYPSNGNSNTGKLLRSWYPASLGFKVGLSCDFGTSGTCKPMGGDKVIKLLNGDDIKDIKVKDSDKSKQITVTKDQEGYNQGYKFNVTSGGISASEGSDKLEEGDYEIKYVSEKGWALSKKPNNTQ